MDCLGTYARARSVQQFSGQCLARIPLSSLTRCTPCGVIQLQITCLWFPNVILPVHALITALSELIGQMDPPPPCLRNRSQNMIVRAHKLRIVLTTHHKDMTADARKNMRVFDLCAKELESFDFTLTALACTAYHPYQGLVYKNGTARNSSEAACLVALATATPTQLICPTLPPPPNLPGCPKANCTPVPDTNTTFLVYSPPSTPQPLSCWTAWVGSGPPDGSVHYCSRAGAVVSFTAPPNTAIDVLFKSGPDCGVMNVTINGQSAPGLPVGGRVDTYAHDVDWTSVLHLGRIPVGANVSLHVTGVHNPLSSNSWVQLTGINVFT